MNLKEICILGIKNCYLTVGICHIYITKGLKVPPRLNRDVQERTQPATTVTGFLYPHRKEFKCKAGAKHRNFTPKYTLRKLCR